MIFKVLLIDRYLPAELDEFHVRKEYEKRLILYSDGQLQLLLKVESRRFRVGMTKLCTVK